MIKNLLRKCYRAGQLWRHHGARHALAEIRNYAVCRLGVASSRELAMLREQLAQETEATRSRLVWLQHDLTHHHQSLRWLAEHPVGCAASEPEGDFEQPLISVVMPVWNRAGTIEGAIQSVLEQRYSQWELLVVDDGSTDDTRAIVRPYLDDERIRLLTQSHKGVSAARNQALTAARGEIVAYLDSDNTWYPEYLREVSRGLHGTSGADAAYAAQLVENEERKTSYIRAARFDREQFKKEGGIDLNAFAHRRSLSERLGGFDESLTRLVDWDLITRYTQDRDPVPLATVGGRYVENADDSVTAHNGFYLNRYRIQRKHETPVSRPMRILYVVSNYPQLTESYVRWEIVRMQRWGFHVEVWAEQEPAAPFDAEAPVHYGKIDDAIDQAQPDLLHVHWLHFFTRHRDVLARTGLPITVRGHGYEFTPDTLNELLRDGAVQRVYAFPHYAASFAPHPKLLAMPSAMNPELYYPAQEKDRRLVVRAASAKKAKNVESFIEAAAQCPSHRFVLFLGTLLHLESTAEELQEYNRQLGSPVDIRCNVPTEEVAEVMRRAGIYLHTYGEEEPFGMPISIAEAMACGCYTLVPSFPGAADYVRDAGTIYYGAEHAGRLIRESLAWYDEEWFAKQQRACEHAYGQHLDLDVFARLRDDWQSLTNNEALSNVLADAREPELQEMLRFIENQPALKQFHVYHRSYLSHILGTYHLLRAWEASFDVRKAGLFHSVYRHGRLDSSGGGHRESVRNLIGERAERLAYLFAATAWGPFTEAMRKGSPYRAHDMFSASDVEISNRDFEDLCRIHLADWIEKSGRSPQRHLQLTLYDDIARQLGGAPRRSFEEKCGPLPEKEPHAFDERAA